MHLDTFIFVGGKIYFDDLNMETQYQPFKAYSQSKLANLLFTSELDRRLKGSVYSCMFE